MSSNLYNHIKPLVSGEYDFDSLLARIRYAIAQVNAVRVSVDCLGAIFTYTSDKNQVRNDLYLLASSLRQIDILRYVEVYGEIRRRITVLKMRGSEHDKQIREFTIDTRGMYIGRAYRNITGILVGNPVSSIYRPR